MIELCTSILVGGGAVGIVVFQWLTLPLWYCIGNEVSPFGKNLPESLFTGFSVSSINDCSTIYKKKNIEILLQTRICFAYIFKYKTILLLERMKYSQQ